MTERGPISGDLCNVILSMAATKTPLKIYIDTMIPLRTVKRVVSKFRKKQIVACTRALIETRGRPRALQFGDSMVCYIYSVA